MHHCIVERSSQIKEQHLHIGWFVALPVEHAHPHLDDPVTLVHVPHSLQLHHVLFQGCHSMHEKFHVLAERNHCLFSSNRCDEYCRVS